MPVSTCLLYTSAGSAVSELGKVGTCEAERSRLELRGGHRSGRALSDGGPLGIAARGTVGLLKNNGAQKAGPRGEGSTGIPWAGLRRRPEMGNQIHVSANIVIRP